MRGVSATKPLIMKLIALITATVATCSFTCYAQEISIKEEHVNFNNGSHNALVVTIPYGNKEVVEKELKSELKDWGGKYSSSKGEMTTSQSSFKAMGDKMFDTYARMLDGNEKGIRVAFAIDLGGAYLQSGQHHTQFSAIKNRVEKFARKAAEESISGELDAEARVLKGMEKEKGEMEKSIESSKKDIEDYKKRIEDAEKRIRENETGISKKEEEIKAQNEKISAIEARKKAIR